MLSMIYRGEFAQGFNAGPNPLDRALAAAQRAVDLAATHALGHYALATVYFFRKEMISFRVEAERALALNPLDASARAYLGLLIAAAGEWDRGCQMVESAMQLNPNCPGYFYFARCCNGYRQGNTQKYWRPRLASTCRTTSIPTRCGRPRLASWAGKKTHGKRCRICWLFVPTSPP